jgi:hypothetical protein
MTKWIVLHEDGKKKMIQTMEVEADSIAEALTRSGLPAAQICACAAHTQLGSVATLLLRSLKGRSSIKRAAPGGY